MTAMRLQKFLSQAGICSRRLAEAHILQGRVAVNDRVVQELGTRVDPEHDRVTYDGKPVRPVQPRVVIALHKPRGYVTSCRQPGDRIVMDLVDIPFRVYPVGRLDRESTGLILLTNDGPLHHRLSHPSFDHEKEYDVVVAHPVSDAALDKMARGMSIMGARTRPARVTRLSGHRFRIVLREGRNRQIRRMVRRIGNQVMRLKRIRIGSVRLGDLEPGTWRYLGETEIADLSGGQG